MIYSAAYWILGRRGGRHAIVYDYTFFKTNLWSIVGYIDADIDTNQNNV